MISFLFRRLPLRFVFIAPFVIQIVCIVGIVGWLSYRNGEKAVSEISAQLQDEINVRVRERLETFFSVPRTVNQLFKYEIESGRLNPKDEESVKVFLLKYLNIFELAASIGMGFDHNYFFYGVTRLNDVSTVFYKNTTSPDDPLLLYAEDRSGNARQPFKSVKAPDYRTRPWYTAAKEAERPVWGKMYQCMITKKHSIALSEPIYNENNDFQGVVAAAFQFYHVNNFLKSLHFSPNGQIFLLKPSGELIAASAGNTGFIDKNGKMELMQGEDSDNLIIRRTAGHLKNKFGSEIGKNGSRQTFFSIDGEKYLVSMTPMHFDKNLEFITVIVVPESDFMGQINKNFQITVLLCLLALIVSVIIGIVTAGWVTAPISHLSSSAKALAEGDWESTVHIDRSDELGELGKAYNSMSRQLRNIFQTLDDRVHERTSELADANSQLKDAKEKAEAASHAKSAFLATMSHELRTPLNGILGYAHILRQDAGAEQEKGLIIIEQSGKHLLSLINDILDLAKVESGRIELFPTEFHFPSFLTGISAMIRIRAEKKGLCFNLNADEKKLPAAIRADEKRLGQILLNLMGNAVKFTEKGSVTLGVERIDNFIYFTVQDTGIGIAHEESENIFKAFYQTGSREHRAQGTGLGLAISRKLVSLMGGNLQMESEPGKGALFTFSLEVTETEGKTEPLHETNEKIIGVKGTPPKILIVDDNPENRSVFRDMLRPAGVETREARDGKEAFNQADLWSPDLIITDLLMPESDGYELIRRLRNHSGFKNLPIIATSACVYEEDQQKSLEAGADLFLPKPVNPVRLLENAGRLLNIEWIFQKEETTDKIPETIIPPSHEILENLLELAEIGFLQEFEAHLNELEKSGKASEAFVGQFQELSSEFRVNDIINRLKGYIQKNCG